MASENSSPCTLIFSLQRKHLFGSSSVADDPDMAARVISPWNLSARVTKFKNISSLSTASNTHSLQGRSYSQHTKFVETPLVFSLGSKTCSNNVRWRKIVFATDSSKASSEPSTSESGTAVTNDQLASSNVQLDANGRGPSSMSTEDPAPRRSSLTIREKLRAARVLSKYMEQKPAKAEFGSRVLEASRESDKGKKRSGLPEAPTNLFDDSKRGLPPQGWTFEFPFQGDMFVIIFSFVFISTVMLTTTFIVWKSGAIHFNEY